ncbi:MAG: GNAT family N-acetyltransferase [Pseudomonadota bacterium]|nr:GNAT family N-acetyltransferase [Pseudomonadota bacterium]
MAGVTTTVEPLEEVSDENVEDLCDAAESAILDGGGFGWLKPPPRAVLGRYFRGVILVPERHLFVGRLDGRVVAAVQLQEPPRNNEALAHAATLTALFVAPWARGHGLSPQLVETVETMALELGYLRLNLDLRATQDAAIHLYESRGFERWGTNPAYALVDGALVPGHYYSKQLRKPAKSKEKQGKRRAK